jgi:hypothetical protein
VGLRGGCKDGGEGERSRKETELISKDFKYGEEVKVLDGVIK